MNIDIISVLPPIFDTLHHGVLGRALKKGILRLQCWDVRDYADNKHRNIDDKPYGGGPGMVMMAKPLVETIRHIQTEREKPNWVVYLSPQGRVLKQAGVLRLKEKLNTHNLVLLCGRYEGIDERVMQVVDEECSIGDYVLSGGELAAMVVIDAIARLLPGVLGDSTSAEEDSFSRGLLEYPQYTRPEEDEAGLRVPEVLLSGNHQAIARWRRRMAIVRTLEKRPDLLLDTAQLSAEEKAILRELIFCDF